MTQRKQQVFSSRRWNVGTNPDLTDSTLALPHKAIKTRGSYPQRSGEALKLSQGWLKALLPSQKWIRWEIATSGQIKYWEGIPGFLWEPAIRGQTMYPTWPSQQLCAMLGQGVWDPLSLLHASPSGAGSDGAASSLLSRNKRCRSDGRKLLIPTTWRSINNSLEGLDAPLVYALSRKTLSPRNSWRTGHTGPGSRVHQAVHKWVPDVWKVPTPEVQSISEPLRPEEFAAALRRLKPGKFPGLDSIFPEFLLKAGSALKSWFCNFLTFCMRQLTLPKISRKALIVAIPKPENALGDTKSYRPISLLCVPFKILERLIYGRVEPIINPLLPRAFDTRGPPQTRSPCWHNISRIVFQLKRRPELCLSASQ